MGHKTKAALMDSGELPPIRVDHLPGVRLDNPGRCLHCLASQFPGRSAQWVMSWLERQIQEAVRLKEGKRRRMGRQLPLPLVEGEAPGPDLG